jgi:hypothetical protein
MDDDLPWKTNGKRGGPRPGAGRKPNIPNNYTREIRDAIVYAARNCEFGRDPAHPDQPGSLERFFVTLADRNMSLFCMLFSKGIPKIIESQSTATVDITYQSYETIDQVKEAMIQAGMAPNTISAIQSMLPVGIEDHTEEPHDDEELKQ